MEVELVVEEGEVHIEPTDLYVAFCLSIDK